MRGAFALRSRAQVVAAADNQAAAAAAGRTVPEPERAGMS